jgi:hypothetical protein
VRCIFSTLLLPLFQIIRRFGISRFIVFTMYLDIIYISWIAEVMDLEKPKRLVIWNVGSSFYDGQSDVFFAIFCVLS